MSDVWFFAGPRAKQLKRRRQADEFLEAARAAWAGADAETRKRWKAELWATRQPDDFPEVPAWVWKKFFPAHVEETWRLIVEPTGGDDGQ